MLRRLRTGDSVLLRTEVSMPPVTQVPGIQYQDPLEPQTQLTAPEEGFSELTPRARAPRSLGGHPAQLLCVCIM